MLTTVYVAEARGGAGARGAVTAITATAGRTAFRTAASPEVHAIVVDTAGLAPGEYFASVTVAAPAATNIASHLAMRLRVD